MKKNLDFYILEDVSNCILNLAADNFCNRDLVEVFLKIESEKYQSFIIALVWLSYIIRSF